MAEKFSLGSLRDASERARIPSLGEIGLLRFAPYLINRLSATYNANLQAALKPLGLTTAKMRALSLLSISSGLTINEISYLAVVEQSTMSRSLDALEEQGLVLRQSRHGDLRVREIHITNQGRAAFNAFWPMLYDMFRDLFEDVDNNEYDAFVRTLQKILNGMERRSGTTDVARAARPVVEAIP